VLRRRRREGGDQPASDDGAAGELAGGAPGQDGPGAAWAGDQGYRAPAGDRDHGDDEHLGGPWDISADYPHADRVDCGSLLIPAREGFDVQINVAEEQGIWVAVVHGDSGMQLQAFAAPRSGGLWEGIRQEIADNIAEAGGSCQPEDGPFGQELLAEVSMAVEGQPDQRMQPVRFLGYDGPRWFLRGVLSGPAASDREQGAPFDEVFADVVVVRGDYPAPPGEQLEIRLPEEARQALEAELADTGDGWELPNPFERGPEITEIR
jgi:hypothetical protein